MTLCRNVGNRLSSDETPYERRTESSDTQLRKPGSTHVKLYFIGHVSSSFVVGRLLIFILRFILFIGHIKTLLTGVRNTAVVIQIYCSRKSDRVAHTACHIPCMLLQILCKNIS